MVVVVDMAVMDMVMAVDMVMVGIAVGAYMVVGMVVVVDMVDLLRVAYVLGNLYYGEYIGITILISAVDLHQLTVIVALGGVSLAYHMSM
jgi:hypothetical protein